VVVKSGASVAITCDVISSCLVTGRKKYCPPFGQAVLASYPDVGWRRPTHHQGPSAG
jgi:hypothetical protein